MRRLYVAATNQSEAPGMHLRKPSPATVIASAALFFALGGTAIAAHHYLITKPGQIKPSVLAKLKGKSGPRVPTGAGGAAGVWGGTARNGQGRASGCYRRAEQRLPRRVRRQQPDHRVRSTRHISDGGGTAGGHHPQHRSHAVHGERGHLPRDAHAPRWRFTRISARGEWLGCGSPVHGHDRALEDRAGEQPARPSAW